MKPGDATLIFDGACAFCRRWIERVHRWDRHARLKFLPYQTADLEARFFSVSRTACMQRMHLVAADGRVFAGAAAGREVLRRLPGGWLWSAPFRLPGGLWVADRVYEWITHRWGPLPRRRGDAFVIAGSATARAAQAGALTSVLSIRYLWARLRRLMARHEKRDALMDAYHVRSAEQVVELMGNMKGLMMKLGQIISFISDDVPEQYRTSSASCRSSHRR